MSEQEIVPILQNLYRIVKTWSGKQFRFDAILTTNISGWNPESSPEINVTMMLRALLSHTAHRQAVRISPNSLSEASGKRVAIAVTVSILRIPCHCCSHLNMWQQWDLLLFERIQRINTKTIIFIEWTLSIYVSIYKVKQNFLIQKAITG